MKMNKLIDGGDAHTHLPAAAHQEQERQHEVEECGLQPLLPSSALPQLQPLLQTEGVTHGQHLRSRDDVVIIMFLSGAGTMILWATTPNSNLELMAI